MTHIKNKNAKMDAHILKANLKVVGEASLVDNPIRDYFTKKEQC